MSIKRERTFQINLVTVKAGHDAHVKIRLLPMGDETGASFTIKWKPEVLTFKEIKDDPTQSLSYDVNKNRLASGELGIAFNRDTVFPPSMRFIDLFYLTFTTTAGTTLITFENTPTPKSVSNMLGALIPAKYVGGRVNVRK